MNAAAPRAWPSSSATGPGSGHRPPANDEAAPATPHPVLFPPQPVEIDVPSRHFARPPRLLFGDQLVAERDLGLELLDQFGLQLRFPLQPFRPDDEIVQLR